MERSRLKSKANKSRNQEDMEIYKRHRNYVVKLNKQSKRNHFNLVDDKSQDKGFWRLVKPFLNSNCPPKDKNILFSRRQSNRVRFKRDCYNIQLILP